MSQQAMTMHARTRQQQRAIPSLVIEWLLAYGRRENACGAIRVSFDKRARRDLARDVGYRAVSAMSKYLRSAIVVDPDTDRVITVEWLH